MYRITVLIVLLMFSYSVIWAQNAIGSNYALNVKRNFSKISFYQGDLKIKKKDFRNKVIVNSYAKEYYRKGNNFGIINGAFRIVGWVSGIAFIPSVLSSNSSIKQKLILGGTTLASSLLSLSFASLSKSNYQKAANRYNQGLKNESSFFSRIDGGIYLNYNQIGFYLEF